ncbi:MAG: TIGR02147 family protein [Chitinispirillaceae bacterium]|nr:TIGR02147 family protein [Chitinispirillaceae bacterium]
MKSIFEYLDYREYLKDFYEEKKSERSFFSYRLFGSKIGLDASYLAKVLIGQRHVADDATGKIAAFCGLNGREAEYFETLVHFVKAKSHKESKLLFEKLLSFKNIRSATLLEHQYAFYRKWYHSAIRSVIEFYDFRGDYGALAKKLSPPISTREAKESVRLLEKLNLIKKDPAGRYRMTDTAITTGPQWHSLAIQAFQEETIRLSAESLARHSRKHREVSTVTMNLSGQNFEEIRERINEFRNSIIKYVNGQTSPDRVVQLNIQLFPLTQIKERKQ